MGKGDKKSRRGKIVLGTYGVRRPRKTKKKIVPAASAPVVEKAEVKSHVKAHVKTEEKAKAKVEEKANVKAEVKSDVKAEVKPGVKAESKSTAPKSRTKAVAPPKTEE